MTTELSPNIIQRWKIRVFGVAFSHEEVLREGAQPTSFYFSRCSIHGYYTDYPRGYGGHIFCPECRRMDNEPYRTFTKNNNRTYRILDETAYEQFWWGRNSLSQGLFEDWLFEPRETMNAVSLRYGKNDAALLVRLTLELTKQNIIDRVKTNE